VRLDIVVVNYRSAGDVARCLDTLGEWPDGTLWLIDNSEREDEARALACIAASRPWVRLRVSPRNLGFGAACNLAFAESTAPYLLLLNPDALLSADALRVLAGALDADPGLGAVSPLTYWNVEHGFVLPPPTVEGPLNVLLPRLLAASAAVARRVAARRVAVERARAAAPRVRPVGALAGAILLVRRSAVAAAGGLFDPRFFMFFEDADLSRRLRRAGFRLALVQAATAVHEYRHKASKAGPMAQSAEAYHAKHHPRWSAWARRFARLVEAATPAGFDVLCEPLGGFADAAPFNARAAGGVVAFSPSPLLWPALFRPLDAAARGFDDAEWALLEPGPYAALVAQGNRRRWVSFAKVAPAPG
jgi:GT2 family glycosyltransferase